ncbi:UDP-N-acetylglucosamine 2-epimerase (non-hydrolyzing) [Ginsengibacter hankyongi]|uniref:UDP-N-acetylglucosamine 2-epimerase (Non-hydrolyzing) n=1 Tax=Ginsengibacter hankyongi TaxID=2607284 RepID=A0A5J5IKD4_9BACT|nr:UDP-N-acetylglucosamine 2-epimerase (non-hydrolyzing) [Ginsengibacter hankyongi]KAA9041480.1 UDP-N-acetylglucosamine 2-epimerase (non-hydrolyzing) [Ginsengibacter hankyongi]
MKILTIIGARPQFIKAAIVSHRIKEDSTGIQEIILHTGQHYDSNMSQVFFEQMDLPKPHYNLEIGNLSHGAMTGRMLESIEEIIKKTMPQYVMVYGDTNSTLAGALAASKLHIPVIHVESGLRSFNMEMPEEINRILTDQISNVLFCPTDQAISNLKNEGFENKNWIKIIKNGDVMFDASIYFADYALPPSFNVPSKFVLATLHRAENTDDKNRLKEIVEAFNEINTQIPVIIPLHPRTKKLLDEFQIPVHFFTCEPLGYFQMLYMLKNASLVMTDSGGLQKEAFFFQKPCVTLRDQTEWVELIDSGYNILAKAAREDILFKYSTMINKKFYFSHDSLYGDGKASEVIVNFLKTHS